jgi:hypothetical protein
VCGTPGSLVHFFPTLSHIVSLTLRHETDKATAPGGEAYGEVEKRIVHDVAHATTTTTTRRRRMVRRRRSVLEADKRAASKVQSELKGILSSAGQLLEKECEEAGCSWEKEIKSYILTFP